MDKIKLRPALFPSEYFRRRTTWFGVAGFDLVLLSAALAASVFGRRTGTRAGSDGASAAAGFIAAGPGAPARPAAVH